MSATFLDRVYINTFSTLPVGKVRYGVMLREDGFVMDDGTTARLSADHYVMTTTTVNAGKVMQHLEYCHQVLWPELDVQMVSVTEQWAQYAVAGPKSRDLLQALLGDAFDVSNEAFPYMGCAEFHVGNIPLRLFRVSFSGELAYEIAAPAGYGEALFNALMQAGKAFGVAPYGTEALSVMRIEKGHVAGSELNGQTVARDLGLGRMMSVKKDYIGRTMAAREALIDPDRPTLVGLRPVDRSQRLRNGALLFARGVTPAPDNNAGFITSSAFSPANNHWIGAWPAGARTRAAWRDHPRLGPRTLRRLSSSKSSILSSSMQKECGCVLDLAHISAFAELRSMGDGRGVIARERRGIAIATVMARKGQGTALAAAVKEQFDINLPLGPHGSGSDCDLVSRHRSRPLAGDPRCGHAAFR